MKSSHPLPNFSRVSEPIRRFFSNLWFNLNIDLVALLVLLVLINYPYWKDTVWVSGDTGWTFQAFYTFYNHFFFHGEWVRWLPYGAYGIPSDIQQIVTLTPSAYLVCLLGKWLHVHNALGAFKVSIFLDQVVLLFGTYLLGRRLFNSRVTVFLVTLGMVTSLVWHHQLHWNFRIFYLLPLILYFLAMFYTRQRAQYFWCATSLLIISLFGNAPYYAPLYGVLMVTTCGLLFLQNRACIRPLLKPATWNLVGLAVFAATAGLYAYFIAHAFDFMTPYPYKRDPVTNFVSLPEFLRYGDRTGLAHLLGLFYAGLDKSLFMGFLPIVFVLLGLLYARGPFFTTFGILAVVLFCITMADNTFLARALYNFFPFMPLFHHIGNLTGLIRFFLLLLAGFGLDAFLTKMKETAIADDQDRSLHPLYPPNLLLLVGASLVIAMVGIDVALNHTGKYFPRYWPHFFYFSALIATVGIALMGLRRCKGATGIGTIILFCYVLEMLSFQNLAAQEAAKCPAESRGAFLVHPFTYQAQRTAAPHAGTRSQLANDITAKLQLRDIITNNWAQWDPMITRDRAPGYMQGVDELFRLRGGKPPMQLPPEDPSFLYAIGVEAPKLRLVSQVRYADTSEKAAELLRNTPDLEEMVVLTKQFSPSERVIPAKAGTQNHGAIPESLAGTVRALDFNPNQLRAEANVENPGGAWLVYADGWHPGWRAWVDGVQVPVWQANLGFKALHLESGRHEVRLAFQHWSSIIAGNLMGIIGIAFMVIFLAALVKELLGITSSPTKAVIHGQTTQTPSPSPLPFQGEGVRGEGVIQHSEL